MSVHGANRLGTNSLLDINVFGRRAGRRRRALRPVRRRTSTCPTDPAAVVTTMVESLRDSTRQRAHRRDPCRPAGRPWTSMPRSTGLRVRSSRRSVDIEMLKARFSNVAVQDKGRRFNTDLLEAVELGFLIELAEVLVVSALARNESRGGHFREDYATRDDVNFMRHTMAYREVSDDGKR